jgi:xanthine dehydrogenase iron-sulfur cluster and FAD-binding subunit A
MEAAAKGIDWDEMTRTRPDEALFDDNAPLYEWFATAR